MERRVLASCVGLLLMALSGRAQAQVPFFGGGAVAFDPEIGTIQSGALLDAQATVSADRKSVMLNMRPTFQRLQSLQPFPVNAIVNGGFVGGVNLPAGNAVRQNAVADKDKGRGDAVATAAPSPDEISRSAKAWVFTRQGTYLVTRLP